MHPLVRGAVAAAVLTALGSFDRGAPAPSLAPAGEPHGVDGLPALCGAGTLPEGPVCIRIPGPDETPARLVAPSSLQEGPSRGATLSADRIPRLPDRPADPAVYRYPVGSPSHPPRVLGGLAEPGIRLAVRPGEPVLLLSLDHQTGPAEVVFAGDLAGRTVVTAHVIEEGTRKHTVLLFHGGMDHASPAAIVGARLDAGAELGAARTEAGGGLIDVTLEARALRDGVKLENVDAKRLVDPAFAVPTDVRNVLPRATPGP